MKASKKLKYILILILIVMLSLAGPWGLGKWSNISWIKFKRSRSKKMIMGKMKRWISRSEMTLKLWRKIRRRLRE